MRKNVSAVKRDFSHDKISKGQMILGTVGEWIVKLNLILKANGEFKINYICHLIFSKN